MISDVGKRGVKVLFCYCETCQNDQVRAKQMKTSCQNDQARAKQMKTSSMGQNTFDGGNAEPRNSFTAPTSSLRLLESFLRSSRPQGRPQLLLIGSRWWQAGGKSSQTQNNPNIEIVFICRSPVSYTHLTLPTKRIV